MQKFRVAGGGKDTRHAHETHRHGMVGNDDLSDRAAQSSNHGVLLGGHDATCLLGCGNNLIAINRTDRGHIDHANRNA